MKFCYEKIRPGPSAMTEYLVRVHGSGQTVRQAEAHAPIGRVFKFPGGSWGFRRDDGGQTKGSGTQTFPSRDWATRALFGRALGVLQQSILRDLAHPASGGSWSDMSSWNYDNVSATVRILRSLMGKARGLVELRRDPIPALPGQFRDVYFLTPKGWEVAKSLLSPAPKPKEEPPVSHPGSPDWNAFEYGDRVVARHDRGTGTIGRIVQPETPKPPRPPIYSVHWADATVTEEKASDLRFAAGESLCPRCQSGDMVYCRCPASHAVCQKCKFEWLRGYPMP